MTTGDRETAISKAAESINKASWSGGRDGMDVTIGHLRRTHGLDAMESALAATTLLEGMRAKLRVRQDSMAQFGF